MGLFTLQIAVSHAYRTILNSCSLKVNFLFQSFLVITVKKIIIMPRAQAGLKCFHMWGGGTPRIKKNPYFEENCSKYNSYRLYL